MKKKPVYGINAFPVELEAEIRALADLACGNAQTLLETENIHEKWTKPEFRYQFYTLAHYGFYQAQEMAIISLMDESKLIAGKQVLYRKVIDSIAWKMIANQLYIARRLYREKKQPSLNHSNVESVRQAARSMTSDDFYQFSLLSDLTTFIQIGDLLTINPSQGVFASEVKEGEVNEKIVNFINQSPDEISIYNFREKEGLKVSKQMDRVIRQKARLQHVYEILTDNQSVDPDSKHGVIIKPDPVKLELWDDELSKLIDESNSKGYALAHIDNCLFVGVYRDRSRFISAELFKGWFEMCGGKPNYPRWNLISGMNIPLALPIFSRQLPIEHMFDIVFGRVVVHLALNMDAFIELCNEMGLKACWSTRKEAAGYRRGKDYPWFFDNRVILLGDEKSNVLDEGIFMRIFFHGTKPKSAVNIFQSFDELVKSNGK